MEFVIGGMTFVMALVLSLPNEAFGKKHKGYTSEERRKTKAGKEKKNGVFGLGSRIADILNIHLNVEREQKIKQKIIYAGLQDELEPEGFIGLKVLGALVTFMVFGVLVLENYSDLNMILMLLGIVMGYLAPDNWLTMKGKNRQWRLQKEIPSVLSSMAVVTDAGYNLIQAIEVVVEQNEGELVDEFMKVLEEIKIGIPLKEAFVNLSGRTNVEELNYFVSAIVQGLEKGASGVTKIIKEQAAESWDKRKHKAKELAEKASMKLFLPLLLLVFPAFMIYLLGPMIFSILQMFEGGF